MTVAPSSCAGIVANAPLKAPTAVRAALAMTMAFGSDILSSIKCCATQRPNFCPWQALLHRSSRLHENR
ncbi:hypothetical protein F9K88_18665 [Brucella intermedia]|nr:hypothetical protein F9K88_18665 [Brucella intermedia]PJT20776.1 hypothetical protein CN884_17040 [Ochrobactrum sp. 30A/1000/2015]PJT40842.1 hypothetical protein CN883_00310 [Ochrobactrum sp. 27A/999/2015]PJT43532.1 hypothetical protein CN882_10870 [Ochrobactrum sp. 23A/997/2015]RQP15614.1 MAG: hypothetical protein EAS49_14770 [Brucella intermedia]